VVVAIIASALTLGLLSIVFTGGFVESIAGIPIRANNAPRIFVQLLIALAALLMLSGKFRTLAFKTATSPIGLAAMLTALAMWMSLGPLPSTRGRIVEGSAIYSLFLDYVPGFSGLRVPARYAMIAALFLVWLAGHGAEFVFRWQPSVSRRAGVLALLSALFFIEAWFAPMATNVTWGRSGFVPPARIESRHASPAVYRHIRTLPDDAVVVEFPFGDPAWELRYVYYATVHWKRLVNGYSGQFPNRYRRLVARFEQLQKDPDGAWNELAEVRPSHAIVHEAAMPPEDAAYVKNWLTAHAFRETHRFDRDVLYTRGRPR
jgi:hypothetical protein